MSEDMQKDPIPPAEQTEAPTPAPDAADSAEADTEFDLADYLKQYQELEAKEKQLRLEKEELDSRVVRLQADFDNFRRRSRSDSEEAARRAAAALAETLLPVLDNFERALEAMAQGAERQGVELIMKQLLAALNNAGLVEIAAQDAEFDPKLHHAVTQIEACPEQKNKITMVLQKGYTFNGKLLRAAMVQVGV